MPQIVLETTLSSPQPAVAPRLFTVLAGYAGRDDFTLTLGAGAAGASVTVPVTVLLGSPATRSATSVALTLTAAHHSRWFPVFRGAIRSEPGGPLESRLWLDGTVETPLGPLGEIADRTVLGHAAERSLRAFVERLRDDVCEEVRRSELGIRERDGRPI